MKRLICTLLVFVLTVSTVFAGGTDQIKANGRPTVAVVLAGGGAKGTAHIGALKVIEECGIPIDIVVGTSMGSIIGGLYSVGYTSGELQEIVCGTDWINLLLDTPDFGNQSLTSRKDQENYLLRISLDKARRLSGTSRGGIIHGRNITSLLGRLTNGIPQNCNFNDFPIAFACVATDAITGRKHVFHEGNLVSAMRSSMAMPTIFTPVKLGDMALVDGGIVDNFPVDVAREMGADIVIGLDLVSEISDEELANSAMDVLMSMLDLISKNRYEKNIKNTDVYIPVNTTGFSAASFSSSAVDTLIMRGEAAGRKNIEELKSLAQRLNVKPSEIPSSHGRIASVTYYQNVNEAFRHSFEEKNDTVPDNVKTAVESSAFGIGSRFDNQEYASIQMALDLSLLRRRHVDLHLYGRLGTKMTGRMSISHQYRNGGEVDLGYTIEHEDLNYFYKGLRVISVVDYHQATKLHYRHEWHKVGYSVGLRYDVDRYRSLLIHRDVFNIAENVETERYFNYFFNLEFNNLTSQYFPTRGTQFNLKAELISTNLYKYEDNPPFPIFSIYWRSAIPLTHKAALIPHGSLRYILPGKNTTPPLALSNLLGGLYRGLWKEQQIEMAGLINMEIVNRDAMGVLGLEFQRRLGKNNFVTATLDGASLSNAINEVLGEKGLFYGVNIGYHYHGIAGPISFVGMWNSRTEKFGALINIGYYF